ncbi:MAG: DUF5119 domain-containing protein [Bacteroides sp.]|nr:DUF5119 domain-containing protein [Bacteroides sp.]
MRLHYSKTSNLLLGALLFIAEGCTHKDLNDDAPTTIADTVEVVFDWRNAPDNKASTMVLYLYPEHHEMMDYWFNNQSGGEIKTYGGRHSAICHSNDDPYSHLLRNTGSYDTLEIFTDNTATLVGQGISTRGIPRAKGTEDEPLRFTPPMIYGSSDEEIDIKVSSLRQTVTLYPEELICHYTVEFIDVENLQNADLRIDATISSLAGGFLPGCMSASSEAVSHTFTLTADMEKKTMTSEFYTFGVPAGDEKPHLISLYIVLKNRTGSLYTFDVSDQVNNATDPKNVHIKVYGLKLPDIPDTPVTPPEGGGVSIEVDTWDIIYFDLKV